ncbi:MAG: cellulase family glycosylhydrolase, partial [Candidatus Omnitrophota bacterium]|nr:cellulase family glycosylhydrolase [Candidatus Omnitrophota bacterium]
YGLNCLRVPFHYNLVEKSPYRFPSADIRYLDQVVRWAEKYKIWVILDLHAAPGAQNHDWHSDSSGEIELWTRLANQKRTFAIWEFLADRYKDKEWVAGYDVLNEAVISDPRPLNQFYKKLIKVIRNVDRNHLLFIEGNHWAQDIACLDPIEDDHYVLSVHHYEPLNFTFNFTFHLHYPVDTKTIKCNKDILRAHLEKYYLESKKRKAPILVGEFGVNYRKGFFNEQQWVQDALACFHDFGFHWAYWTYKAIKNSFYPDGVFSYEPNPPWVNRGGPVTGWNTYSRLWPTRKKDMCESWHTDQFAKNDFILQALQNASRKYHESK